MTEIYEFIDGEKGNYSVNVMCGWMGVSRSGFYEWRDKPVSATIERRDALKTEIQRVFAESHGTYGYRRVHAALAHDGVQAGPELVRLLMRQLGLHPGRKRPTRSITAADPAAGDTPDLINRDFTATEPGHKLVGDITFIPTGEGWLYLATVIDCATRKVVGWATADHQKASLACAAITTAARNIDLTPDAIFHSDRGVQYTSPHSRTNSSTAQNSPHERTRTVKSPGTSNCSTTTADCIPPSATSHPTKRTIATTNRNQQPENH